MKLHSHRLFTAKSVAAVCDRRPICLSFNPNKNRDGDGHRPPLQYTARAARTGFTLVEMLLVLVILATLAAIVIPKFAGRSEQAKNTAAKAQISSIELALDSFEVDNGFYPKTGALNLLVDPPNNVPKWQGPYLKQGVPLDPWGNSYSYDYPGKHHLKGYDLMSPGPDGRAGTDDDVTNWDAGQK